MKIIRRHSNPHDRALNAQQAADGYKTASILRSIGMNGSAASVERSVVQRISLGR